MTATESDGANVLVATYKSPDLSKTFTHQLMKTSDAPASSTNQKSTFLSAVRSLVPKLQDEINVFLTQRMAVDKAKEMVVGASSDGKGVVINEGKEEENYGEEIADDD